MGFLIVGLALVAWGAYSYREYKTKLLPAYNKRYPEWLEMYHHGFYCHRCRNVFLVKDQPVMPEPDPIQQNEQYSQNPQQQQTQLNQQADN